METRVCFGGQRNSLFTRSTPLDGLFPETRGDPPASSTRRRTEERRQLARSDGASAGRSAAPTRLSLLHAGRPSLLWGCGAVRGQPEALGWSRLAASRLGKPWCSALPSGTAGSWRGWRRAPQLPSGSSGHSGSIRAALWAWPLNVPGGLGRFTVGSRTSSRKVRAGAGACRGAGARLSRWRRRARQPAGAEPVVLQPEPPPPSRAADEKPAAEQRLETVV